MVDKDELVAQWRGLSAAWIERSAAGGDAARAGLLDEWMLRLVGDVSGLDVIDLGCGEGRFCRMLAARGARTLGVDLQPGFIAHAESRKGPGESYRLADMESLDGVPDEGFDLAVSYISLVDVPDSAAAIRQAHRVLRPGGRFLVCDLAPMATAAVGGPWWRDVDGRKIHYVLDDYTDEGPRWITLSAGHQLVNFHRMLSTTVNSFLDAGFVLRRLHEPVPTQEQVERVPDNADLHRVPIFVIYDVEKPSG